MEYKIFTGYGVSDVSYTSTPENRLQGSGQGGKLLERDLNFGLKWAFAWRLGKFADKQQLYKQNQHALPGKWCHSPALNKTLTFDLLMQTHIDGAFGD